ncbi:prephenate dehydratase [Geoglobus ahangari]
MRILIYGMGGMGGIFHRFFENRGYFVKGYDLNPDRSEVSYGEIDGFDVIFLCVPMDEIENALEDIARKNRSALIVDISTLKNLAIPHLERLGFDYLSIHPMFGPDSEIGLSNIIVVHESGREEERVILEEFRRAGAIISHISVEEHDRKMAEIQGTAHFLLFLFALTLRGRFGKAYHYGSPIFLVMHKLASRIINQDWRLYYHIQKNAEELRKEILENARVLDEIMKDERSFKGLVDELREEFDDYRDSTIVLDAYKTTVNAEGIDMLRGYIRAIDSLVLRLIEKRVEAGRKVAMEKLKLNEPVEISHVEDVKLRELVTKTELNPVMVSEIFERLMKLTKEEEYRILGVRKKVAVLGPPGSFSEETALKLVGSRLPLIYQSKVEDIFLAVESGKADYGIVPIENSLQGTVLQTLDALLRHNVEVFAEYESEIRHNLVAKKRLPLRDIEVVYSHPQAIAQCSEFINNYLPHAEIRYTRTTSEAIEMLDDRSAAIASELAAKLYRLQVIKRDIQSLTSNRTRFYIIRRSGGSVNGDESLTCLFFGVDDRPGALYRVLEVFYKNGINLRKLESRPAGTRLGDYIFFAEAEEKLGENIVEEIKKRTTFCKVAGFFRKVDRLDVFTG